jgi:hypothetical protein
VFYTPLYLPYRTRDVLQALPALRTWRGADDSAAFETIVTPRRVYRARREVKTNGGIALHAVTSCDLDAEPFDCDASVVVGPPGRVFYVSPRAVYVWVSEWRRHGMGERMLYRMPLDGSRPSAIGVAGSPVDQFSFLESDDGFLNVLVRSEAAGDAMWLAQAAGGSVALLRLPITSLGDGSGEAPTSRYRSLPMPPSGDFQNRFVHDYLLYGAGSGWGMQRAGGSELYAVPWRGGEVARLALPHGADRIEVMGQDALVVGSDALNLHFSGVALGEHPGVTRRFVLGGAAQGELRSHGFFYKPDDGDTGVLGLPVRDTGRPGYQHLFESSASIVFLRNARRGFEELGELESHPEDAKDDGCRASCVDWYGNARPLFLRGRIFALLGYELVEGRLSDGRIGEARRVVFSRAERPGG